MDKIFKSITKIQRLLQNPKTWLFDRIILQYDEYKFRKFLLTHSKICDKYS
jgi:hypothetical protein